MGSASSKGELNAHTHRLHAAIAAWNVPTVKQELSAGAVAAAYRPVPEGERFAVFSARGTEVGLVYGLNALGKFASEVHLRLEAADAGGGPPPFTARVLADMLSTLLAGGVDPTAAIERAGTEAGGWRDAPGGGVTLLHALRRIVLGLSSSGRPDDRIVRSRGSLLWPCVARLLENASVATAVTTDDLFTWTAAHHPPAVAAFARMPAVTLALPPGAPPRKDGTTSLAPLIAAVSTGNAAAARQLLDAGAAADVADVRGRTALMHATGSWDYRDVRPDDDVDDAAASRPTVALVELLLQHGADVRARDDVGRTALHHFAASKISTLEPTARRFVCIRLVRGGLSLTNRDNAGWTPVNCALERRDAFLVGVLKQEEAWMRRHVATVAWTLAAPGRATGASVGRR